MSGTIHLLIEGRLSIAVEGQLELPKQPPFNVITPGAAARVIVSFPPESPDCIRLFDRWWETGGGLDVIVFDGERSHIRATMRCVGIEHMDGIQITRPWSEPLRKVHADGFCRLYRPTPRFQHIVRPIHQYTLEAQRYTFVGPESTQHDDRRDEIRAA